MAIVYGNYNQVLDNYVNKDLFEKIDGIWQPKYTPGEDFQIWK